MAIVAWLVAFPLIQILNASVGHALAAVPTLARGALLGAVMVTIMTYVAMPWITARLRRWLYP